MTLNFALQSIWQNKANEKKDMDVLNLVKTISPMEDFTETFAGNISLQNLCTVDENAPKMFVKYGVAYFRLPDPKFAQMPQEEKLSPDFGTCLYESPFDDDKYGQITQRVFP